MRRAGPASRAFGRYAVGLRPILDPDPYFGAPKTSADNPKEDQPRSTVGLTRPRSFRNDKSAAERAHGPLDGALGLLDLLLVGPQVP